MGVGLMKGEFHYTTRSGVELWYQRWKTIYRIMLQDARATKSCTWAEVLICGHLSYWLEVSPKGLVTRVYLTKDEEGRHEKSTLFSLSRPDE